MLHSHLSPKLKLPLQSLSPNILTSKQSSFGSSTFPIGYDRLDYEAVKLGEREKQSSQGVDQNNVPRRVKQLVFLYQCHRKYEVDIKIYSFDKDKKPQRHDMDKDSL